MVICVLPDMHEKMYLHALFPMPFDKEKQYVWFIIPVWGALSGVLPLGFPPCPKKSLKEILW